MKHRFLAPVFALSIALATVAPSVAARSAPPPQGGVGASSPTAMWYEVDESTIAASPHDRVVVPLAYRVYGLDEARLDEALERAPLESSEAARVGAPVLLTVPMPDGSLERFRVEESPILAPELAARFPQIRTFVAIGIDDPTAAGRLDRTPAGFHAMVRSSKGTVFVDPYRRGDTAHYLSYFRRDFVEPGGGVECLVAGSDAAPSPARGLSSLVTTGPTLRTYRLALACTGEYAAFHGGTVDGAFAAMTTSMNRVNFVYEADVAIRMVFVANNTSLVYTNAATDPYTNNSGGTMLNQNQSNVDSVIGSANYDIGHVFSTGGGGVAGLGVVCRSGQKAKGVTGLPTPVGDPFDIDYVAHEMGHQYGANHTFNGTQSSCLGNRNASTAYEPGSGSTIMAYAGICGSVNLQSNSDAYFHGISYTEIVNYTTTGAGTCATQTPTGNGEPVADAGAAFTIPVSTPFELTAASASDPNGDGITYCWEEFDLGASLNTNTDNGSSPILRSFDPSAGPTRTLPRTSDLVNNTTTFGEVLPTTSRTMNFRLTVRDNRPGGGGVSFDTTTVTSTTSAGPFAVTAPNASGSFSGGSPLAVTWNVANTSVAPVNAASVSILLSLDGGVTFPVVLLASTPNDGSESVTLPNANTATARIKVKAVGNVFFDISNANFSISSPAVGGDSLGVFTPESSAFFLRNTNTPGAADLLFTFGVAPTTFVPVRGDWNGDHADTIGLYDPASGFFYLRNANVPGVADLVFGFGPGGLGWLPLSGDWNGDGVDTIGLYDPSTGNFFLRNANAPGAADVVFSFGPGGLGFVPITGDWDANLTDTVGIYDPATGAFFLRNAVTPGPADLVFSFGAGGASPLAGDWDLDGRDTVGIYLAGSGTWFLRNSNAPGGADVVAGYGPAGATPVTGDWDAR